MRKGIGIVVALVVVGLAAGLAWWSLRQDDDPDRYARYLPAETLMSVSVTNLNQVSDSFGDSPLGRLLAKETMGSIFAELHAEPQVVEGYNQGHDDLVELLTNPAFRTLFGDDTVLALLPPDPEALARAPLEELERSLVLFATTPAPGAVELLARLLMSESVDSQQLGELSLTRITLEDGRRIYGFSDQGTVLLGRDPHTLARCWNAAGAAGKLANLPAFQEAVAFWEEAPGETRLYSRSFVQVSQLQALLGRSGNQDLEELAPLLEGISFFASRLYRQGRELHSDSRAGFAGAALHPVLKAAWAGQAEANTTLGLLGEQSLVYDWSSSLIPEVVLGPLGIGNSRELAELEGVVEEQLGVSLATLLEAVGPQYGFVINEIVDAGFIPIPRCLFFAQVRDHQLALTVLERLRERLGESGLAAEQQLKVGEQTIHYWPLLPGEATQPAMVLTPTMFYLANGSQALVELLGSAAAPVKLRQGVAAELGEEVAAQLEAARQGALVVYPARLAGEIQGLAQWLINTVAAYQGITASRLGAELIQLMASYQVLSMTSTLEQDHGAWSAILVEGNASAKPMN
ncbi:hypothetical protein [Desulfogranum mediterraneum]|uniref:hypothetical protein n=1 Tax=Desulfogranum mediterraneum TaxID=160661 RepID=UPI00041A6E80|nr:hypothetical protein [Desulfogranum mediterraneum]